MGGIEEEVLRAALDPRIDPALERALARNPASDTLAVQRALRRELSPELARGAAELAALRQRARGRLPDAERLVLTARGLAQASSLAAANARAREVVRLAGGAPILDTTAGIGGDAIALARAGAWVVAADRDPTHARCAQENLSRLALPARVVVADALSDAVRAPFVVADPDRRAGGERSLRPERWSPPFAPLVAHVARRDGACIKLPPGAERAALDALLPRDLARRFGFVGVGGELVELVLWTGALCDPARGECEALLVDAAGTEHRFSARLADLVEEPALDPDSAANVACVVEPHGALLRSGLVGPLARALGTPPLGPRLGFLGADAPPTPSPFHRTWRVVASCPADPKRVRAMATAHGVGEVKVSVRGHPDPAAELAKRFAGAGERHGRVLVARLAVGHRAYLVEPVRA